MKQPQFETYFNEYRASIEEAKAKKAHHDQLRSIFLGFLNKAFGVKYDELELEKGVQIAKVKGYIDALYQDVIFEFKRDMAIEREKGLWELDGYIKSLDGTAYFGILTDGITFEVYAMKEGKLAKIDSVSAKTLTPEAAFIWFDAFLSGLYT